MKEKSLNDAIIAVAQYLDDYGCPVSLEFNKREIILTAVVGSEITQELYNDVRAILGLDVQSGYSIHHKIVIYIDGDKRFSNPLIKRNYDKE